MSEQGEWASMTSEYDVRASMGAGAGFVPGGSGSVLRAGSPAGGEVDGVEDLDDDDLDDDEEDDDDLDDDEEDDDDDDLDEFDDDELDDDEDDEDEDDEDDDDEADEIDATEDREGRIPGADDSVA